MANLEQRGRHLKRGSVLALVALLAACGEASAGSEAAGNAAFPPAPATTDAEPLFGEVSASTPPEIEATPAIDGGYGPLPAQPPLSPDAGKLPPAAKPDRYEGRWAEKIELCGLKELRLSKMWLGDGSHSCRMSEMRRTRAGGYTGIAWCTDRNAPPGQLDVGRRIDIGFDEKAQRMRMEGGLFASPALVFCGAEAD